ncbi:glycosyltransferase family 2 protein [Cecembia calidifontis]|uniref:GT2 family glycosyltransferase n=1 Tax=Cecembia calidifontis TaxID=1187080 RepID=A0A4Q7PF16_9BACT|nr:glycosyltransferase family 2 protein [Cecembia calidifontis]RZS98260.1 GT2 family glycosyltransferase [Cecembia calidifontis]
MKQALVSVIIPTFQRSEFLARAIDSVLNQTYKQIEIIVVDDNDGENEFRKLTKELIVNSYGNKGIVYVKHEWNKGLPSARNTGINAAKGEYIAFLDDDDEWLPEKIEKQLSLFLQLPEEFGVISCGWNLIDSHRNHSKKEFPKVKGEVQKVLALNYFSPPSMVMVKRKYLERVNGFDEHFFWREDIELYYRLAFICKFEFVPEVLVNYYYHSGSMSRNFPKKLRAVENFIEKHQKTLKRNKIPWSEIHERKGDLAAASGELHKAIRAFLIAYFNRRKRFQILIKMIISLFGGEFYIKQRKL